MSTFILRKENIEKIVNANEIFRKVTGYSYMLGDWHKYAQALYNMNINSYNARYKEDEPLQTISILNERRFNNEYELLKTFKCLRYNIDLKPGNQLERNALDWLDSVINILMNAIIYRIPEYERADWD